MTATTVDRRSLRLIVAALVAAVLLSSLDAMIFNTALPTIVGQLHGIARMSWVPTAYLLTTVITMPVYGKLGDLLGRKWLFVAALALSLTGSVFIFSSVAGPLLGGWFASTVGWRWAFWMNVPVAMLAITAAITPLHPAPATARQRLAAIGLAPVPLRLLADRDFVLATVGALCGAVAMFGTVGYLPTYLQMVDRLTPTAAGLHMVPVVLGIGTTAFTSGHIMSRTGRYAWMPVAGAVIVAAALAVLWSLRISTSPWLVSADAYLFGAGMGFGMQTLTIVAQNSFPAEVGTATASFAFFREIGAALGAAAVGGLFTARLTARLGARLPGRLADAHSLTPALVTTLPADLRERVAGAYHDALIPLFGGLAPMMLGAALLLLFVRERPVDPATIPPAPVAKDLVPHGSEG